MARFIQLISPILHRPGPGRFAFNIFISRFFSQLSAWMLVIFSFYCCLVSESILLLGVATVQIALSLLILLELLLKRINKPPLESRRLEMTAYCMGGMILLLLCIFQFSEGVLSLRHPKIHQGWEITLAVVSSVSGNLILIRSLWRFGLIRGRIRTFCRPLLGILLLNVLSLFSSLLIQVTQYVRIDAWMGLLSSIILFVIAAGVMIDAYWRLLDIEMRGLKKQDLEAF